LVIQKEQPTVPAVPASGPVSSFDGFFLVEFPRMVAFATVLVGDRAVAEDLAQEAMLRAFRNWETVSGYDRPGAWVRRVTANLASSSRRRRGIETRALERVERPGATTDAVDADGAERFWALVRALPTRQREAVALHYLEDWSVRQIADFLGCAESTAKAHLQKARRRLAAQLEATMDEDVEDE
jgi:RNA polymerase sigma-70 factor, ECF subfamily